MTSSRVVRIGGAAGAWGDSPMGVEQLITADVQYMMMDYLAEVTMSLLARARIKDPHAGYPADFVEYLRPHMAALKQQKIKVVSNAGGVNPEACKRSLEKLCEELDLPLRVAVVTGDDLLPCIDALRAAGVSEWVSGEPLPARLLTANAYLGAVPIARALAQGADIVVTGRCADSALGLGILMHEFGWRETDYDLLAAGTLVGHVLECGPQATGGVFTDWERVPGWHNIGYPIAECYADGTFLLTKPANTGGLIHPDCVAEQVLYEVGDPRAYILPDVVADFSEVRVEQAGPECVKVSGARGYAPTSQYKVSATYQDGYRAVAMAVIIGVDAVAKAQRSAEALVARARMLFARRNLLDFKRTHIEVLGGEASYLQAGRAQAAREVVMRLVVEHDDANALSLFARELGSVGLGFAQGTAGLIGGRPKPGPVVRLFNFFVDKADLVIRVQVGVDTPFDVVVHTAGGYEAPPVRAIAGNLAPGAKVEVPLLRLAHARSGDKGDASNIAVYCRRPEFVEHLRAWLTPERLASHFQGTVEGSVTRYESPGLHAFNFVLQNALGGGGMASMRIDPQGKAYGQRALEILVPVPSHWLDANGTVVGNVRA
jgi:hypothetical protein